MAVDVDLELEGEPRLELDRDQPQVPIQEVVVEKQALPRETSDLPYVSATMLSVVLY
jgi:hypothetical protein